MVQDRLAASVDADSAPLPDMRAAPSLQPKTVTVFLDASASGRRRAMQAVALARRWGAHLVLPAAALNPSSCYAVGRKAIDQVISGGHVIPHSTLRIGRKL